VAAIVARQGVALRSGRPPMPREEADRIIELYRDHSVRVHQIARHVGRSRGTVYRLVKRVLPPAEWRGIGRYPNHERRYGYRADLFADPLAEDEMWLFGLLMADGSTDGRWRVVLRLAVSDLDAVEAARWIAGSDAPIAIAGNTGGSPSGGACQDLAGWALDSSEVVARLARLGMVPAKSHRTDVTVPARVASSASFWRGVIDGDGTVCWTRKRTNDGHIRRRGALQVLGGEPLLRQWTRFVVETIGGPMPRVRPKPCTHVLHVSVLSGSRAWHMLKLLYGSGGPALARKRAAALAILADEPPTPKAVPRAEVENALGKLGGRGLASLPERYVCPETGVRLGKLVHKARRGQRPDLHPLFAAYDPNWHSSAR
jgi:Homeodomain-like domain